jgi:hypothetical protein
MPFRSNPLKLTRRRGLQLGSLGMAGCGLSLPRLLAAETDRITARADNCILLFLDGGPSHLDMWDMKPHAPDGIRGEFKPIDRRAHAADRAAHSSRNSCAVNASHGQ